MDVYLKHPFSMLVSGGRFAGKSEFSKNLIKYREHVIEPTPKRIVWCYSKHQPSLYCELLAIDSKIEYVNGIPENMDAMFDANVTNLIILDDMMDEGNDDKRVSKLFTKGRHDNLSVIFLTQNLFHQKQRAISLNSDYMVIFKNPRDLSQFSHLAQQVMPHNKKFLQWAYLDATKLPHTYLLLDLKANTNDKYRVRANIIPTENNKIQYVYIPSH